jgi:RNA polymerase sigma factor (sigma-70 family)
MSKEKEFLKNVNEHIAIVYKVSRVYFQLTADREDAVQEILFQLWKSFPSFNDESKFSTWLYKVALNTALTMKRKHDRSVITRSVDLQSLQFAEDPAAFHHEQQQVLYKAIHSLGDIDRAIILLFLEGNTYDEIAQITGLSKSNVSVRLFRLKRNLEDQLNHQII